MDIHVDLDTVKLFCSIVVFGALNGYIMYRRGMKRGWDDLAYELSLSGYIDINNETLEISRVSDMKYKKFKQEYGNEK